MWRTRVTQTRLAEVLGLDQSTLSKKLRGKRPWSVDELVRVAHVLGRPASFFLGEPDLAATASSGLPRVDSNHQPADLLPLPLTRRRRFFAQRYTSQHAA